MQKRYVADGRGWIALTLCQGAIRGDSGASHAYLEEVYVFPVHRRRGIASRLLRRVTADADREDVALYLDIVPGDGMDADQLRDWYGRHGFVSRTGHMWRAPRQTEQPG